MRDIKVIGWYNHGNTGDEAFKIAFPSLLPDDRVTCVESLKSDDKSDFYILGGGDVVYEAYLKSLRQFPDKRKIAASISLTHDSSLKELDIFEDVYVRDDLSAAIGADYVDAKHLHYLPDATFLLKPDPVAGHDWLVEAYNAAGLELYNKVVVCVISSYVANNKRDALSRDFINFLNVANNISNAADNHEVSFVFLPFSIKAPNDDRMSNAFIASQCKFYQKNYVVYQNLSVQTTINILSCAQAVVSTRLHSTIFSTISGVPFIDLTHHDKNLGFIQTLGKSEWSLPFYDFSTSHFNSLLSTFISEPVPNQKLLDFTNKSRDELNNIKLFGGT